MQSGEVKSAPGAPELPDLITLLANKCPDNHVLQFMYQWENVIYSLVIMSILCTLVFFGTRRMTLIPGKLQNLIEVGVEAIDDLVCGILGKKGRKYTPFIGTIFFYILFMNLSGLIPFVKSSTGSWGITAAFAICVFVYVQYTAVRELGFLGYIDHLAGSPRGVLAFTVVIPVFVFFIEVISQLMRPFSLSLRLRSVIWGDDILLAVLAHFGIWGVGLLFINMCMVLLTSVIQALVFTLLTTVYFALVLDNGHGEETTT